jgi:hypothetical protein
MADERQAVDEKSQGGARALDRRRLLAGGAALAGLGAARLAAPGGARAGHAAPEDVVHMDVTNTGAGSTRVSSNISGTAAFVGLNNYPVGISRPDGILGRTSYTTSNCAGVAGTCEAASGGIGVLGTAKSTTGTGVYGFSGSVVPSEVAPSGTGVYGKGPGRGVLGRSSAGPGVQGEGPVTAAGVYGYSGGAAPTEAAPAGTGVFGRGPGLGVLGRADAGAGVQGETVSGSGVRGSASGAGAGVVGSAGPSGLAGRFVGRTVVEGRLEVVGAPASTLVRGSDGANRRVYAPGAQEPWIELVGEARLRRGRASVRLPADFDALVQGSDYLVLLTEYGNHGGVYVTRRRGNLFQVRARKRRARGRFGYRVVAKRRDLAV